MFPNFISLIQRMLLESETSIAAFSVKWTRALVIFNEPCRTEHWSKSIDERALEDRQVVDESPPIKRLELAAISRPSAAVNPPCQPTATSVESILIIPPPTIHLRTAMTRTIFPTAFNYPRTHILMSERANATSRNIDRSLFSLSLPPPPLCLFF